MAANTGWNGGAIRLIELALKKPFQWNICLLRMIELALRSLVNELDGVSDAPNSYSGPICKKFPKCEELEFTNFIPNSFQCQVNVDDIIHTINTDQKYLLDICTAILMALTQ